MIMRREAARAGAVRSYRRAMEAALGPGGYSNCHSQGNCMTACPIGLSPTRSIAGLKKMSLLAMVGITP